MEAAILLQRCDILEAPRFQIVDHGDGLAQPQQVLGQMAADEARAAGNQCVCHKNHPGFVVCFDRWLIVPQSPERHNLRFSNGFLTPNLHKYIVP